MVASNCKYCVEDQVFGAKSRYVPDFESALTAMHEMWLELEPGCKIPNLSYLQAYYCLMIRGDDGIWDCGCKAMRQYFEVKNDTNRSAGSDSGS
jgi:hypothetical protein